MNCHSLPPVEMTTSLFLNLYRQNLIMSKHTLDARNILCPMPVIKTQNKIAELQPGDLLEVTCTDPGAINDITAWCRINGHLVKETHENDDEVVIIVQVGS